MKKTVFIAFTFCISLAAASGQSVIKMDSMPVAGKLNYPLYNSLRIICQNQKGTVYALPQDNMPALRPDTTITCNMPVLLFRQQPAILFFPKRPGQNPLLEKKQQESLQINTPEGPKQIKIH